MGSTMWVSNHGARQLETSPATIDVLPSIREAVGPDVEIIMDGGVQRGTDICKALALGADAVGIGKPFLWGLAAGGEEGVYKAIEILRVELIVPWVCLEQELLMNSRSVDLDSSRDVQEVSETITMSILMNVDM